MLYNAGTIAINGNTATGTGANWTAPASQVRAGQTIIVLSTPVQIFQISSVDSATSLTVTPAASPALSGQKYGILISDNVSIDGLAQAMSQLIKEYDENIGAWETFATTSANQSITVTINGIAVTIPAIGKLAQKGANGALGIKDGGTGATTAEESRKNLDLSAFLTLEDQSIVYGPAREQAIIIRKNEWGAVITNNGKPVPLGTRYGGTGATTGDYWGACTNIGAIRPKTARFVSGENPTSLEWKNSTGFITGQVEGGAVGAWMDITSADEGARMQLIGFYGDNNGKHGFGYKVYNPNSQSWYNFAVARDTNNTTIDSNGFIKAASPIVNIFWDGTSETNAESEGCVVTRISVGEYLIEGCTGLNADAAWGGTDGGFEIPLDRNKQPRIWLDYTVNADSFVSVRVEMPVDSLFNQKMRPTEKTPHAGEGE